MLKKLNVTVHIVVIDIFVKLARINGLVNAKMFGPFCNKSCSGKYGQEIQVGIRIKEVLKERINCNDMNNYYKIGAVAE